MARPEPFRALLEKAMQAEAPVKLPRSATAQSLALAPTASPAPTLDDEHKRPTLEQRLDAAILAAGATPPHGLRPPKAVQELVPLRLPPTPAPLTPLPASTPPTSTREAAPIEGDRAPSPRMLQFLLEERTAPGGLADESVSAIPRLEPVFDSGKVEVAVGVSTNVYRLARLRDEDTPSRPLPVISLADLEVLGDDVFDTEVSRKRRADKVVTRASIDGFGIRLRAFSLNDTKSGDFDFVDDSDSRPHAAAAVALPVLSEEGLPELDDVFDSGFGDSGIDELARQLGLEGLVPRTTPPQRADDSLDGGALDEASADDIELVAVATPTNPMRAMVMQRPVVARDAVDDLEDDDDGFSANQITPPSGTRKLPPSLLAGTPLHGAAKAKAAFDENEVTPALVPPARPSLEAPSAVRFVVAEAPARPRRDALSPRELERARTRAHDLYLIALDDLACKDAASAVVHLELALAYDDTQPLYHDLLTQLLRQIARNLPDVEH